MGADAIILMGSARENGNTALSADALSKFCTPPAMVTSLAPLRIESFRYDPTWDDAFQSLVESLLRHEHIVFATPVYWYAMSGVMKTFFDRFTDLLDPSRRPLGRALAGRPVWALVTGTDPRPPTGFAEPFRLTATYFGMKWCRLCYLQVGDQVGLSAEALLHIADLSKSMKAVGMEKNLK